MNGGILGHCDESGFQFQQEMLKGTPSAAINFDCLLYHPIHGTIIIELLQVSKEAQKNGVTPYNSHPNRYWHKNKQKFISLWNYTQDVSGKLLCVNYAPTGTKCADMVGILRVVNATNDGYQTQLKEWDRETFSRWYRQFNKECREFEGSRYVGRSKN